MTADLPFADCPSCTTLAADLAPGESDVCPVCGAELSLPRDESPRAPSLARLVDTLLRDSYPLALWLTHSSARAISLEPERHGGSGEHEEGRVLTREQLLTRGKALAARLEALEQSDPVSGAVVRWLAERGGPARIRVVDIRRGKNVKSLGSGWHEEIGKAFVSAETLEDWKEAGDVRMPACKHGKWLLEATARAWAMTKDGAM